MTPDESSNEPLIGTVIHGFRVEKVLGEGGMGKVFVARHESLPIYKVVKVLLPEYSQNAQIRARFLREAESVACMDHPHVITVDNFGSLPSGELFLMMPLLTGRPLDEYLRDAHKLGPHHTLQIAAQIGSALAHAHAHGIIHRDLKPGNIFLERKRGQDTVKLLDFGIAKDTTVTASARTRTGMAIGTPHYMACEQYDDAGAITNTADVFALAVVIVELLTGDLPWGVHDQGVLYFRQKTETPTFGPEVPRAWIPILIAALSPDPAKRPQSARGFIIALANVLDALPPIWPTGVQIVKDAAPDLIKQATHEDATVRARSSENVLAHVPGVVDMTATVNSRPRALHAAPTTLSASNGVTTPQPVVRARYFALIVLGMGVAVLVGMLTFFITHGRKNDPAKAPDAVPQEPRQVIDAGTIHAVADALPVHPDAALMDAAEAAPPVPRRARPDAGTAAVLDAAKQVSSAGSDLRLKIQSNEGQVIATNNSCGSDAAAALWRIVRSAPQIEVADGAVTIAIDGKKRSASRVTITDSYFAGFFDREDASVLGLSVHHDDDQDTYTAEISILVHTGDYLGSCIDKWRGKARRI